jgi:4-amino-4-deoxy-L-arabinose transferase-like glycosyltransferase
VILIAGALVATLPIGSVVRRLSRHGLGPLRLPHPLGLPQARVVRSPPNIRGALADGGLGLSLNPADGVLAERTRRRGLTPLARIWAAVDRHPLLILLAGGLVATAFFAVNLTRAPDFNIDEVFYSLAGQNVLNHDLVAWGDTAIFVHPPLYFLTVGAWLKLTGHEHSSMLDAIHTARYLGAAFDVLSVVFIGHAARVWSSRRPAAIRGRVVVTAMALAALNPFLLRFGRTVLIEPMALCLGIATLLLAWRLRSSQTRLYVGIVGLAIGVSILTKMPLLFLVCGPLIASLIGRDWRGVLRNVGALLVGAFVWLSFPAWAIISGNGHAFLEVQNISVLRLMGHLQMSGLHRSGVSATAAFLDSLGQYSPGYVVFSVGAIGLGAGVLRIWHHGRDAIDEGGRFILGLGVPSYAFLAYSVLVGQANEQLTVYTIPASVLLAADLSRFVVRPDAPRLGARVMNRAGAVVCLAVIGIGTASWFAYMLPPDNATTAAGRYITITYPCRLVNATGDIYHWAAALPVNRLAAFPSGPDALAAGVHVFLLSPKDAEFRYGSMSPQLEAWIRANGQQVFSQPSHTYREISVWVVGTPPDLTGVAADACGNPLPTPTGQAKATTFLALLGAAFATVCAAMAALTFAKRRRSV